MYTSIEVLHFEKKRDDKYIVHYQWHSALLTRPKRGLITTDILILATGPMGTTQIIMRSQMKGLRLPKPLGCRRTNCRFN